MSVVLLRDVVSVCAGDGERKSQQVRRPKNKIVLEHSCNGSAHLGRRQGEILSRFEVEIEIHLWGGRRRRTTKEHVTSLPSKLWTPLLASYLFVRGSGWIRVEMRTGSNFRVADEKGAGVNGNSSDHLGPIPANEDLFVKSDEVLIGTVTLLDL